MSEIIFGMNVVFVVAVLIWGVLSMIKIHIDYKRRCKLIDEWYQQEMEWLKEQEYKEIKED